MGKKYSQILDDRIDAYRQAERETTRQFMIDMFSVTLNDSDIMGKDVFGESRLVKVINAVGENYDLYHEAIEKSKTADVAQDTLDKKLKRIFNAHFDEFPVRYPWIVREIYKKKK